ncbi:MAG: peptidoglycan DD-metalloendopeptidase family protein [Iphinoe sp. HA4291-MV1]|jgi:murein DD-endopeptidase MepM/ murein hydrolase activator NlpD|nr:peptidoglycan DD-metalloendopeptidase family protein [Iphinoe sp. HA4291-MV1]
MYIRVPITRVTIGKKLSFETGDGLLESVEVSNSEQERASSCSFSFFDPQLRFLNLFMTNFQTVGGILIPSNLLEDPTKTVTTTTGGVSASNITGNLRGDDLAKAIIVECRKDGVTMPEQIAYICATVQRETDMGRIMVEQGSREYFNYLEGRSDIGNTSPGDGFTFRGRGFIQLTGKINYQRWSKILGIDLVNNPDLAAEPRYALPILVISMRDGLTTGRKLSQYIRPGSIDFFNARRVVNALDHAADIAGYARQWLAKLPALSTSLPTTTATTTTPTLASTATIQRNNQTVDVSQGILIRVELGFNDSANATIFDYLLTGVSGSNDIPHVTKITGRQVRYVISKTPKKFTVHRNTSIKQLVTAIAQKVGANVSIADTPEVKKIYDAIRQQETDYQLLLKLAKQNGFFVRGDATTLKLEQLKADEKTFEVKREALLSANWGEEASSDRVLVGQAVQTIQTTQIPTAQTSNTQFISPTTGIISRGIIPDVHYGLDIANDTGTPVVAAAGGTVTYAGFNDGGYGNLVIIQHNATTESRYAHGQRVLVSVGQQVSQGQAILIMDSTGNSTGPHLHFEVRVNGKTIDPLTVLPPLVNGRMVSSGRTPNSDANDTAIVVSNVTPGIQALTAKADESKGIGKGFTGDLTILTARQPEALQIQPGNIIKIADNAGYGGALTREYRVESIRHTYNKSGLVTAISFYLPVSVKIRATQTSTASSISISGGVSGGTPIPKKTGTYMYYSPTGQKDEFGADLYKLALIQNGKEMESVNAVSGYNRLGKIPRSQDSSGSGRRCPTGVYKLDPVRIGGNAVGVGKYWIAVNGTDPRFAIGLHSDWNRYTGQSGTSGCIGIIDPPESEGGYITSYTKTLLVVAWRNSGVDTLVVNHGIEEDKKYLQGWI